MASSPTPPNSQTDMSMATALRKAPGSTPQLPTPEEPLLNSFSKAGTITTTLPPIRTVTISPGSPTSPALRAFERIPEGFAQRDDALYPDHNTVEAVQKPLFDSDEASVHSSPSPVPAARKLAVRSTSHLTSPVEMFATDGMAYYQRCLDEVNTLRAMKRQLPLPAATKQVRDRFTNLQLSMLDRVQAKGRVSKAPPRRRAAAVKSATPVATKSVPVAIQSQTPTLALNGLAASESPAKRPRRKTTPDERTATPDAKPRTRAPATKKKEGPSPDGWYKVPDYCPPASSLDAPTVSLVLPEWKNSSGNAARPLDLSKDADAHQLAPKELELASALRLPCNMYLLCKRNIFAAKLKWLQDAKEAKDTRGEIKNEFNKTAAQNVCTIDVNKVSKLWTAFNRVGWFDEHWFQQWL